ncbi:Uu.00g022240.m01.CDS01 [Anthostomella pinea]|uniref:Peroxidase n=1 Tax=Anthostomella pinea TaxID=933095 RepID=A0AAI8YQZ3_9PEZI|nr:Uu.00g022240.m01.CDS01 [Anthostomella pinea]
MRQHALTGLGLLQAASGVAGYVWPSQTDYLEDLMMLHSGYIRFGFIDSVNPCSFGTNVAGRQNAAEWIRTAYHDMSTHDAAAGTGGVDASIMFELERPENIGDAFNNTFGFLSGFYSTQASASDLIALAVVTAAYACNGPDIPFRAGRIDATEAGPSGVPKPEQDLATHTSIFATAGFNTTDMITMVACGHTLGGVHGEFFPQITGNSSVGQKSRFEGDSNESYAEFDNVVVTDYLEGGRENVLVAGSNETTNSDKRVFGADGNVTMNALADPAVYQAKCANILERMINTVPATVTLGDAIQPIDIKPYVSTMGLNSNGTIDFEGRIRVRTSTATGRDSDDLAVHMTYAERDGTNASSVITTTHPTYEAGSSFGLYKESFTWFEFAAQLDPTAGISKFNVHLSTPSTGVAVVFDNEGNGFPLDDSVLYQQPQSCLNTTQVDGNMNLTVSAAVRKNRVSESLMLDLVRRVPRQGLVLPALDVQPLAFEKTETEKAGYVLFTAQTSIAAQSWSTSFDVVLGDGNGQSIVEYQKTSLLTSDPCVAL